MQVAIASGKGGTGKTTLAVNLALVVPGPVRLLDCDVEEPNAHLFLGVRIEGREPVGIPVPEVDEERCTACGACGEICQYSAIVALKTKPILFPQLCHGCGGCQRVCPTGAIREVLRPIGELEWGRRGDLLFAHGRLNVGEAMAPPVIRAVKRWGRPPASVEAGLAKTPFTQVQPAGTGGGEPRAESPAMTLIDVPPGTSCPVIEAVRGSDFVLLVTEPTPFGLHDLRLAVELVRRLDLPCGVVINRDGIGDDGVEQYCLAEEIPILQRIPDDRRVAHAYSRGEAIVEALPEYREQFSALYAALKEYDRHAHTRD